VAESVALFQAQASPVLLATTAFDSVPYFAAFLHDGTCIVPLQNPNGVARADPAKGAVLQQVGYTDDECENPAEANVARDGRVFMVCEGDHHGPGSVLRLDPDTLAIEASVTVGVYPERMTLREP
jgi:hypothetical protein